MKRSLSLLLALLLLVTALPVTAADAAIGDVSGDGQINAADALCALQHSVQLTRLDGDAYVRADVDGDNAVNAADALKILQYSVKLLAEFPIRLTAEEQYFKARDIDYGVDFHDFTEVVRLDDYNDPAEVVEKLGGDVEATATDQYELNENFRLIYNRLSKDVAKEMDKKYSEAPKTTGTLEVDGIQMTYSLPQTVDAYDCVPIDYTLVDTRGLDHLGDTVYVEATGYEEAARAPASVDSYDCTLPGSIAVQFDYLGYVAGTENTANKPHLKADPEKDRPGVAYPSFTYGDLIESGTVAVADFTWFKFRYTNVGDTVLDGEGNGGFTFHCTLEKKQADGTYSFLYTTPNEYQPLSDYLYPGESGEMWLIFNNGSAGRMPAGEYRICITGMLKNNKRVYNYGDTLLFNTVTTRAYFPFTAANDPDVTAPAEVENINLSAPARCGWIGTFEEFLTSYNAHIFLSEDAAAPTAGRMYLQVASFTEQVGLKLMVGDKDLLDTACLPVTVKADGIRIHLNPYNQNYQVKADGTREPQRIVQNMVDMRGHIDKGPDCASIVINDLRNMREAGINFLATTNASTGSLSGIYDMTQFMFDAARVMGFNIEARTEYYYRNGDPEARLKAIDRAQAAALHKYTDLTGQRNADEANGKLARYEITRYGDLFWMAPNGVLPISVEDNWGWLGFYINDRYFMTGTAFDIPYRAWLQRAYGSIEALNAAYESDFASFDDITVANDGRPGSVGLNFRNPLAVYRDWNRATLEMDLFRTVEHMNEYKHMLEGVDIEGARVNLRSENLYYLTPGIDPNTKNPHYRLAYYDMRRAALVPEIVLASGVAYGESSYSSFAYSPSEVYELTRQAVKNGLNIAKTADYHVCIDNVVNTLYGTAENAETFHIAEGQVVCNIVSVNALFPNWKAAYEAGGTPGTMWMDYCCDTLVTSTQYKEILFYKQKTDEMLATPEGRAWAADFTPTERPYEDIVIGAWCYPREYVESQLQNVPRYNRILQQHTSAGREIMQG